MANVLVVEPNAAQAKALEEALRAAGHDARHVASAQAALEVLESELVDLVLAEAAQVEASGGGLLAHVTARWPEVPVIIAAPGDAVERAMQAVRAGAADFLSLPCDPAELAFVTSKALTLAARRADAPPRIAAPASALIGDSAAMRELRSVIERTGSGSATTLVRGETGTGKELVARAVHDVSARRDRPFVKIDCASLPDTLLESELFGYEKGAFTGAVTRKPGRIELAEGGTLFLDEIGEVSLTVQAKLLRLLQERVFERLGGRTAQRIDVRFVLATHRDLEAMVDNGSFRQDLFHRLNVVPLWLAPLRARREDIEPLARHFAERSLRASGKQGVELTPAAVKHLRAQRWPGNVRELENFVERLVVLADGPRIDVGDVERALVQKPQFLTQRTETASTGTGEAPTSPQPLSEAVRRAERAAVVTALKRAEGNRSVAARVLGVSRATLYNKLKELGIEQP